MGAPAFDGADRELAAKFFASFDEESRKQVVGGLVKRYGEERAKEIVACLLYTSVPQLPAQGDPLAGAKLPGIPLRHHGAVGRLLGQEQGGFGAVGQVGQPGHHRLGVEGGKLHGEEPVSYTHLDVYKRQVPGSGSCPKPNTCAWSARQRPGAATGSRC